MTLHMLTSILLLVLGGKYSWLHFSDEEIEWQHNLPLVIKIR